VVGVAVGDLTGGGEFCWRERFVWRMAVIKVMVVGEAVGRQYFVRYYFES
jgi:hypothetical protein